MASSKSPSAIKAGNDLVRSMQRSHDFAVVVVVFVIDPLSLAPSMQLQRYRKEKGHAGETGGELLNNMLFGASPPRQGLRDITQSPYYDAGTASGEAKKYTPMLGGSGGGDAVNTSTVSLSTRLQSPKDVDQSARQRSMLKVYMANQVTALIRTTKAHRAPSLLTHPSHTRCPAGAQ